MTTLIHDATVITSLAEECCVLPHHDLLAADGCVVELRPTRPLPASAAREAIAGQRHIVVPGLVNTHHHLFQSLTRALPETQNLRLFDWLRALYGRWRNLDARAVNLAAKVSLSELLLHGCTTTSDHFYMFPPASDVRLESVVDAAQELGIRIHLCRGAMSLGRSGGGLPPDDCVERDADVLRDSERVLDAYHDPRPFSMRRIDLAPCSPFNVTRELLRDTRVLARERGVLLHTHLAETIDEQEFCQEKFGCRPVRYLEELDWLGPDVYLAHCVHLDAAEIALLARTRTAVALCPTSNMRLGSGLPPLRSLLQAGARVGLGVDGSSSNDGGNMLAEARMALLTTRLRQSPQEDEPLWPAQAALRLATAGGAACLNRPELGHLNPGAAADFAMFRTDDIALAGAAAQDPLAALVLCDAPRADRVFVAGREVVRDGRLVTIDEHRLAAEFNELVASRFR